MPSNCAPRSTPPRRRACRATRFCSPNTISTTAPSFDGALRDLCIAEDIGVITYFSLAKGFLSGKYRTEADLGQSPRGGGVKDYFEPARLPHSGGARRGRRAPQGETRRSRACLDHPAQGRHRADRQRDRPAQLESLIKATTLSLSAEDVAALDKPARPERGSGATDGRAPRFDLDQSARPRRGIGLGNSSKDPIDAPGSRGVSRARR